MKRSEYESKHPGELYTRARELCKEYHDEAMRKGGFTSRFCNHCYKRQGWKCFPCNNIAEIYEERYGETIPSKQEKE